MSDYLFSDLLHFAPNKMWCWRCFGWMRETCQLLIVEPLLPGFVSREDNSSCMHSAQCNSCRMHTDAAQLCSIQCTVYGKTIVAACSVQHFCYNRLQDKSSRMHRDATQLCSITGYMPIQLNPQVFLVAEYFCALQGSQSALKCRLHPLYHLLLCSAQLKLPCGAQTGTGDTPHSVSPQYHQLCLIHQ